MSVRNDPAQAGADAAGGGGVIYEIVSGHKDKRRGPFMVMADGHRIGPLYRTRDEAVRAMELADSSWRAALAHIERLRGGSFT